MTKAQHAVEVGEANEERERSAREAYERALAAEPARSGPPAEILTLISTLAAQALMHLGAVQSPLAKAMRPDRAQARHAIDLLGVLDDKTRGNLTAHEEQVLRALLTDLRQRYAEAT